MVCLFSQASGSALVPLKCKAWIPSKAPFSGLNDLWFSSHFAATCLGQETWGDEQCWATTPRSEQGRMPFALLWLPASLMDHRGYPVAQHLKSWKDIFGLSGKVVFLSSCHLIALNCSAFQGRNLMCQDGCSSSFLKDESASTEFPQRVFCFYAFVWKHWPQQLGWFIP